MNTVTASQFFDIAEPLPGYRMQERIGAGGYGEVWRAEAPGGLAKAIKVIYGLHDDERAVQELNALNRIKEVRHPFLLSIERIELVDGHLVIVTELASSSMKNLFEQYRQSGLLGIPRVELLAHLGDAADALDYISQKHSLQHLDIKPENLLLVGGRTKVADFGLVKDLQDVHSSIISGLTPVYAAPELFDGRPTIHSDQYSLAIVYQEMLTGVPPFEGRTAAQLAAQHLHSRPQLDSLPASDRDTIGRALSKNPAQRFPSCRDMVASLLQADSDSHARSTRIPVQTGGRGLPPSKSVATEVLSPESIRAAIGAKAPVSSMTQPTEPAPMVCDLPPLELSPEDIEYRPTIFVGIGGLAAQTLQTLHSRLVNRFGDLNSVPALQFLLLETDSEALKMVTEGDEQTPLNDDSVILLPLRSPADYRQESDNHLQWLSRRWIYNIPRSLQTRSLRPLGRLAFVEHLDRVRDHLCRVIKAATDREGLAVSAQKTGLPFVEAPPRVFLVSSISGGTGGGMVLDVAYLVRKLLRDLGLSEEGLCGILAHCSGHNHQGRDLAVANAYAFLAELRHYSDQRHGYPGDPMRGLPAFDTQDSPFNIAYLVHLGENLEPAQFAAAADKLAKYLYCNTVTPAHAFFDKCRTLHTPDAQSTSDDPAVRTFGLAQLGVSYDDIPATVVDDLCNALVTRWRDIDRPKSAEILHSLADPTALLANHFTTSAPDVDFHAEAALQLEAMGLSIQPIVDQLRTTATREMGDDPESYLLAVLADVSQNFQLAHNSPNSLSLSTKILDALDALMRLQDVQDTQCVCLESVLETHLKEIAASQAAVLREWIFGLVSQPKYRVAGAKQTIDCLAERLRALSHEAGKRAQALHQQLSLLRQTLLNDKNGGRDWLQSCGRWRGRKPVVDQQLCQYFRMKIEELTLNGACRLSGLILGSTATLDDKLRNLTADLNHLAEKLGSQPHCVIESPAVDGVVAKMIDLNKAELLAEMNCALEQDLHRVVATEEDDVPGVLLPILRRTARSLIHHLMKKIVVRKITTFAKDERHDVIFSLRAGLEAAMPLLSDCGGARRLLLVAPGDLPSTELVKQLSEEVSEPPTVVADKENEVLLCYEMEQLPLRRVAAAVLDRRFKNVEVASRLHTRIDVTWSPL